MTALAKIDAAALVQAHATMRTRGVDCDSLAFHLTEWQAATVRGALAVTTPSHDPAAAFTFRGVPVYADATDAGYLIVPPSPYNDRSGTTGIRVDIEGPVA